MQKRGVSSKVVITLIILIALTAIAILWLVIFPIFGGSPERNIDLTVVTANNFTVYDPDTKLASVEIARGNDAEDLTGFNVLFDVNGKKVNYKVNSAKVLSPGTSKVYKFDLADYTEPDSVEIYPIFGTSVWGEANVIKTIGLAGNVIGLTSVNCTTAAQCNDNNVCTIDLCSTGRCSYRAYDRNPCNDNNPATTNDVCSLGVCSGTRIVGVVGTTGSVGVCGSFSTSAPCPAGQIRCSSDGLCKQITCIKSNCFVTCSDSHGGCPVHIPTDLNDPNYCPIGMDSCVNDGTGCTYPCSGSSTSSTTSMVTSTTSSAIDISNDWNTRNACTSDAGCELGAPCISGVCGGPINIPDLPCGGADFNGDGIVNGTDIAIFNTHVGMANPTINDGDFNGDGAVIGGSSANLNSDWRIMMHTLGMTCAPRTISTTSSVPVLMSCETNLDCTDNNPCTNDICNPSGTCTHSNNTAVCNDNNSSTTNDICSFGVCSGTLGGTDITDNGVTVPLDLGVVSSGGDVISPIVECILNSADWSTNQSSVGSSVGLSLSSSAGCDGSSVNFTISRKRIFGIKTSVAKIFSVGVSNGGASAIWKIDRGFKTGSSYVFDAEVGSSTIPSSQSLYISGVQSSYSVKQTSLGSMDYALTGANNHVVWNYTNAGDFNGDGKDDIIAKSSDGRWYVAISNLSSGGSV